MGNNPEVIIGGDSTQAQAAIQAATQALKDGVSGMAAPLGQLSEGFSVFTGLLASFAGILAGGAMFKEALSATNSLNTEISALSKKMGISTDDAGKLSLGLRLIGSSSDVYTGAAMRLDRQLRTNEEGLQKMGVATRDANGHLLNQEQVMDSALKTLMTYKEGTDRNLASQTMFGRGSDEMTKLLKLNNEVKEEATRLQKAFNMEVGAEGVQQTKAYKMAMAEVGIAMDGIMNAVGKDILPLFVNLGAWFKDEGVTVVSGFIAIIDQLGTTFSIVGDIIVDFWQGVKTYFKAIFAAIDEALGSNGGVKTMNVFTATIRVVNVALLGMQEAFRLAFAAVQTILELSIAYIKRWANMAEAAVKLDWSGVKKAWEDGTKENERILDKSFDKIVKDAQEAGVKIEQALFGEGKKPEKKVEEDPTKGKGTKNFVDPNTEKGPKEQDKRLQEWKNQLDKMKEAEGAFFKDSKQMEEQFWTAKLAEVQGNGEKEKQIRRAIEHELFNIHKAQAIQNRALQEEDVVAEKNISNHLVDIKKEELRRKYELGLITETQMLQGERALAAEVYDIEIDLLSKKEKLYAEDVLTFRKIQEEKLQALRAYQKTEGKIIDDIAIKNKKSIEGMLTPITDAISTSVQGIVQGTTTMRKAISNIFKSIMAEFVSFCAKQLARWAATELAKTNLLKSGTLLRTALEKAGLLETESISKSVNASKATDTVEKAGEELVGVAPTAAAKGADAMADIPYVGPVLAIAAFAAILAMILGSRGHAVGKWDVPSDMITKIHKGEMIVPEQFATSIREGGLGGGGQTHIHINAVDSKSVTRLLQDNASGVSQVARRLNRNFAPRRS